MRKVKRDKGQRFESIFRFAKTYSPLILKSFAKVSTLGDFLIGRDPARAHNRQPNTEKDIFSPRGKRR